MTFKRILYTENDITMTTNVGLIQKSTGIILRETSRPSVLLIGRFRNCSIHHPLFLLLTNVKDKGKPKDRQGAVYKIKCCDCQATYIGETGQTLALDWPSKNERREMVTSTITSPNTMYRRNLKSTGIRSATCITYSTDLLSTTHFRKLVY